MLFFLSKKTGDKRKMLTESTILERLRENPEICPPLRVEVEEVQSSNNGAAPDAIIEVKWRGRQYRFAAEIKSLATPKVLEAAMSQAQRAAKSIELRPMVVMPYLSARQLRMLEAENMSGLDLCGNGIVQVPGKIFVYRTGQPNAFPASSRIRNVYQGSSSIVARVFLLRPRYSTVGRVLKEVERCGGNVSMSTVSKVLKALEQDLMIRRKGRGSCLIQPRELLEKLAENYQRPIVKRVQQYCLQEGATVEELSRITDPESSRLVLTGALQSASMRSCHVKSCIDSIAQIWTT